LRQPKDEARKNILLRGSSLDGDRTQQECGQVTGLVFRVGLTCRAAGWRIAETCNLGGWRLGVLPPRIPFLRLAVLARLTPA
jgi:hypothetical protein